MTTLSLSLVTVLFAVAPDAGVVKGRPFVFESVSRPDKCGPVWLAQFSAPKYRATALCDNKRDACLGKCQGQGCRDGVAGKHKACLDCLKKCGKNKECRNDCASDNHFSCPTPQ